MPADWLGRGHELTATTTPPPSHHGQACRLFPRVTPGSEASPGVTPGLGTESQGIWHFPTSLRHRSSGPTCLMGPYPAELGSHCHSGIRGPQMQRQRLWCGHSQETPEEGRG